MLATLKAEANEVLAGGIKTERQDHPARGIPGQRL